MNEYHTSLKSEVAPSSSRRSSRVFPGESDPHHSANVIIKFAESETDAENLNHCETEEKQRKKCLLCSFKSRQKFRGATSYFQDYCGSTSLHGLKYMGEARRPLVERICWILAFGLSIYACSLVILKVWRKWENSPVIVSFADSSTPVWQIPFPAVTICSEVKYRRNIYNYSYINQMLAREKDISSENRRKHEYKSLLCEDPDFTDGASETIDIGAIQFFQEAAPPCDDFFYCEWKGQFARCCRELFRPILTEEGVCYTFNMLATTQIFTNNMTIDGFNESFGLKHPRETEWSDWNAQDGYPRTAPIDTYPHRGPGAGASSGLHIYFKADPEDYDARCRTIGGFKVLLHNPSEFPRMSELFFRAPLNQDVVVSVKPNIMGTTNELQDYPSSRRRCLFQRERQLRFFTHYTQRNCELECLVNTTLEVCHCMPFFMPSNNISLCGIGSIGCIHNVTEQLQHSEILNAMKMDAGSGSGGCNCLPACTELNYDAETSMGEFDFEKIMAAFNITENESDYFGKKIGKLSIFFKEWQFITSRRGELYGQTDFLANCGGLLGLFMGFSFLSLVEIIYFFTLRLFNNIKGATQDKDKRISNYGDNKQQ
ncbi:pickpocket protein 28-like [Ischnura elegans]|uniref:pickpocket protein 28-like n=1 Tax=Ischnura elegans TaxID=197161 RepID=UPI001ED8B35D|nr:pickpocket protein 28-like [Ischnura elegans]